MLYREADAKMQKREKKKRNKIQRQGRKLYSRDKVRSGPRLYSGGAVSITFPEDVRLHVRIVGRDATPIGGKFKHTTDLLLRL